MKNIIKSLFIVALLTLPLSGCFRLVPVYYPCPDIYYVETVHNHEYCCWPRCVGRRVYRSGYCYDHYKYGIKHHYNERCYR